MKSRQEFMEIISGLDEEQFGYMNEFFKDCPDEVMQAMQYVRIPEGQAVLQAGTGCEYVWAVIKGEVSGDDIQMPGNVYSFLEYSGPNIMGDYELFAGLMEFQKTIYAVVTTEAFRIPTGIYMKWVRTDQNALFMRAKEFARTLATEISSERKYLLLNAKDRLILYLVKAYGKWECDDNCILKKTQSQLAQHIGANVRTVQRSILRLEGEGFLSCQRGKIHISRRQYEMLKEYRDVNLASG